MKSNIQLKYSNYVAFSHIRGKVVNNSGSILVPATEEEQRASSFPHTFQGTILADGVRLRSTPSESATVLELMYSGERVWIDEGYQNADWYHVTRQSTGRTGYVYWEYLQPDFQR